MRKIIYKIFILVMLLIMCSCYNCYASDREPEASWLDDTGAGSGTGGTGITGDPDRGLPNVDSVSDPASNFALSEKVRKITATVLGWIAAIGGILITVLIAVTGFETIMGSAEEKAFAKEKMMGYIIAAALVTSGSAIASFIINAIT